MSAEEDRKRLVGFLKSHAFEPVLAASPDGRPEPDKRKLAEVQDATRSEIARYERYGSAGEVVRNFKDDLDSEPARKVHRALKSLGLPTLNDIRGDFEDLASKLGVSA